MKLSKRIWFFGGLAGALIALPVAAIASHGKAGLWSITVTAKMGGAGMPQMPHMTPEQMAQMKAMGMRMPSFGTGQPTTVQHCMTAAEVNSDRPPPMHEHECTVSNIKMDGHTYSADMTCTGNMEGTGHTSATYDSAEHYSGKMNFTGVSHGHQITMDDSFEGKWLSADCGTVAH